jgi:hypothetical protein
VALYWRNPWHCSTGGAHVPTAIVMRGGTETQTCRSVQSKCSLLYLLPQPSRTIFLLTSVYRTNNNDLLKLSNIHSCTILSIIKWFYPCTSSKLGTGCLKIKHTLKHILHTHFPENWRLRRVVLYVESSCLSVNEVVICERYGKCGSHLWEIWNSVTAH